MSQGLDRGVNTLYSPPRTEGPTSFGHRNNRNETITVNARCIVKTLPAPWGQTVFVRAFVGMDSLHAAHRGYRLDRPVRSEGPPIPGEGSA